MRQIIETEEGQIVEVTNLFDEKGRETKYIPDAVSCVLKFSDDQWMMTEILHRPIHTVH